MDSVQAALDFGRRLSLSILVSYLLQSILFVKQLPGIAEFSLQVVLRADARLVLFCGFPLKIRRTETTGSHHYKVARWNLMDCLVNYL